MLALCIDVNQVLPGDNVNFYATQVLSNHYLMPVARRDDA